MSAMPARLVLAIVSILAIAVGALAEEAYPARPITMVVTFAAGGSSDVLARAAAELMSHGLGQQIAVDNRPGAGGQIGAELVASATPDGYTVLFGTNGTLGIGPALYKHLRYDPAHDLAPVGILHKLPLLLIVNPSVPAKNLKELIAYARENPGKLSFASAGVGSVSHLAGELLKEEAKIDILHVPYKGGGAAVPDLHLGARLNDARNNSERIAVDPERSDARHWRDHERAFRGGAGHPDARRIRPAGLRRERLDRTLRAGRHPRRGDRSPQCRNTKDRERQPLRRSGSQDGNERHQFEPAGVRLRLYATTSRGGRKSSPMPAFRQSNEPMAH